MSSSHTSVATGVISITADEVLRQTARNIIGTSPFPVMTVECHTTRSKISHAIADALKHDHGKVFIHEPNTGKNREIRRQMAKEMLDIGSDRKENRPIQTGTGTSLPTPPTPTKMLREAMRKLATMPDDAAGRDPYLVSLPAWVTESYLPSLSGGLYLEGIEAEERDPNDLVSTDKIYWDTGAHKCIMSEDLCSSEFLGYLRTNPDNAPYTIADRGLLRVACYAKLQFSNTSLTLPMTMEIRPTALMPNGITGVLLGNQSFMQFLQWETIPRSILVARGHTIAEEQWGVINIKAYLNVLDGQLEEF
ncbi:hypothetical protein GP486_006268 [Trichoglossum hirsutum]|uniref:Uncharacterized protein n=1 Tax=Trichoglossum hirsutum TaxID=265104 RepID=A0A9P8IHD5_9PEZI|nr:hypothetical protein GP486_006268 [Trichoglossum hirsutum]